MKIAVLGGGNFGSAIADLAGSKGNEVLQWFRTQEAADDFNTHHENRKYLPGFRLSDNIRATADLEEAVKGTPLVFMCIPSTHFRSVARQVGESLDASQILVSTTKGIEAGTFSLMTEVLREETCTLKIGALSGPNLAKEIIAKTPSGTVIASRFDEVIQTEQETLSGSYYRLYSNRDVEGDELAGVLKNV
jgi:glycerol-3-phosphate dehydrogenase (NAD(P)+)